MMMQENSDKSGEMFLVITAIMKITRNKIVVSINENRNYDSDKANMILQAELQK